MSVFALTTPPKADALIAAFDATGRYSATWKRQIEEGKGAIAALLKGVQSWLPLIVRDVPGFSATEYGDKPTIPDDVIADAARLRDFVSDASGRDGKPITFRDACLADLDERLRVAEREWGEADAADKQYQALSAALRAAGEALDAELVALRKAIAVQFGRSDRDYQKLRTEHAGIKDEDDDPNAPPPPVPVQAAGPGTTRPNV